MGRFTSALYRKIGVTDTIARDHKHYAELAVKIATDKTYREDIKQRTIKHCDTIYNDTGIVNELAECFVSMVHATNPNKQ